MSHIISCTADTITGPRTGKPAAPRFHVYFPVDLTCDAAAVTRLIDDVLARCSYFDPGCSDLARFFFGVEHPEGEAVPGDLTLDSFMERQTAAPAAPAGTDCARNQCPRNPRRGA